MNKIKSISGISLAAVTLCAAAGAQAETYTINATTSAMTDFRRIGVSLANAAATTTNPLTWDAQDGDQTTGLIMDPFLPVLLSGSITVEGGVVTAATLTQQSVFRIGSYQSPTSQANLTVNGLTWTFNPVTNRLVQAALPGAATCVLVNGAATAPGGCAAAAINGATAASILQFDGHAANLTVTDGVINPLTGGGGTGIVVNLGGGVAKPGISWDLSDFATLGIIKGLAVGDQPSGFNPAFSGASAAMFSVQVVPVPAAVWLFGSGLAAMAALRRKRAQ